MPYPPLFEVSDYVIIAKVVPVAVEVGLNLAGLIKD